MNKVTNITSYPAWLDVELWRDYLTYRREVKKELTPTGEKRALMKLKRLIDAGGDQTAIIEKTIDIKWLGLFPQKPEVKESKIVSHPSHRPFREVV